MAKLVVDGNCSIASVSRIFDVSYDAVSRAVKRKKELEDGTAKGLINPKAKKMRKCLMLEIGSKLIDGFEL